MSLNADQLGLMRGGDALVSNINLALCPGDMIAIVGPNGAGKTSLLRLLSGELRPDTGAVLLDGHHLDRVSLTERARRIAVLPQHSTLDFPFLAGEVVAMGLAPFGGRSQSGVVAEVMALLGCDELVGRIYTTLSGGEKQRIQIARVLAQAWRAPGYLLLDEPTAPLDLAHQLLVLSALKEMAGRGAGVLLVMHDINLAARYVDRLLLMSGGTATAFGSPQDVLAGSAVGSAFGVTLEILSTSQGFPQLIAHRARPSADD